MRDLGAEVVSFPFLSLPFLFHSFYFLSFVFQFRFVVFVSKVFIWGVFFSVCVLFRFLAMKRGERSEGK